jgi:hypothetical protein
MPPDNTTLTLHCHPATPAPVVRSLEAHAAIQPDGSLKLAYRLRGDMAHLLIPEEKNPARTDSLWEHTCFEAFVSVAGDAAYREFNFSPSGQWAAYAFTGYRMPDDTCPLASPPQITTRRFAGRLEIEALIPADALPAGAALQIALSAVVEAADVVDGSHSYWALHHVADRPDFHQREAFVLVLDSTQLTAPHHTA